MKHWITDLLLVVSSVATADPSGVLKLKAELREIIDSVLMSD